MKKNFIIHFIILVGVISIVCLFLRPKTSSALTLGDDYLGTASYVFGTLPGGSTLDIGTSQGTVTMNNFYSADPPVDLSQYIIIKNTDNYIIDYDPTDSSFWIGVSGIPFSGSRSPAEQDFLTTLGISQGDACKLDVAEGVIYDVNNPDNSTAYPLSFCGAN